LAGSGLADKTGLKPKTPIVLVVEDEVLIRLTIANELRSSGLSVVEAANADEALTVLRSSARVDLLFTDIQMPGSIDGVALAELVRKTHPALKIVIASSVSTVGSARDIPDAFFGKPYDTVKVMSKIKELLVSVEK
jgi:CheY-like chemotaxis protein